MRADHGGDAKDPVIIQQADRAGVEFLLDVFHSLVIFCEMLRDQKLFAGRKFSDLCQDLQIEELL